MEKEIGELKKKLEVTEVNLTTTNCRLKLHEKLLEDERTRLAEKEKEIAELKERLKEKDKQLRTSLDTWLYFMHGFQSDIQHALPRIYAMQNEIGKE